MILFLILSSSSLVFSQGISINATGTAANASAILDVSSTTQGMLIPRMTLAQKNAIASPADGLTVHQTDNSRGMYFYDISTTAWMPVGGNLPYTILDGSAGNAFNFSSNKTTRLFVLDCNGRNLSSLPRFDITLPAANNFPPGTVIRFALLAQSSGNADVYVKSSGASDKINGNSINDADFSPTSSGTFLGAYFSLMTDGVSRWFDY